MNEAKNVLGTALEICCTSPMTGFYRDGCCNSGPDDIGAHLVCAQMTEEFLIYSKAQGNDLSTPAPEMGFSGLVPGDRWCLCLPRWKDALDAGKAPPILLAATHEAALELVTLEALKQHALDLAN